MLGMQLTPEPNDQRIDLDCRDASGTVAQGGRDVVSHPGTEDQYRVRIRSETVGQIVGMQFNGKLREELRMSRHELCREIDDPLKPTAIWFEFLPTTLPPPVEPRTRQLLIHQPI